MFYVFMFMFYPKLFVLDRERNKNQKKKKTMFFTSIYLRGLNSLPKSFRVVSFFFSCLSPLALSLFFSLSLLCFCNCKICGCFLLHSSFFIFLRQLNRASSLSFHPRHAKNELWELNEAFLFGFLRQKKV